MVEACCFSPIGGRVVVLFSVGVVVLYLSKLPYGKSDSQVGLLMVMAPAFHVEYWFSGV